VRNRNVREPTISFLLRQTDPVIRLPSRARSSKAKAAESTAVYSRGTVLHPSTCTELGRRGLEACGYSMT